MKPFDYPFRADGREYTLRYSWKARREFERKHKRSVPGMLKRLANADTQTADELVDVFTLMLSTDNPQVTADEIEKIIEDLGGEDEAITLLGEALSSQLPVEDNTRPQ